MHVGSHLQTATRTYEINVSQAGKLHFGVILGWSVAGSTAVWFVVNNMAGMDSPDSKGTGLYNCTCLLGYGMLPMVLHALLCLLVPRWDIAAIPQHCVHCSCCA